MQKMKQWRENVWNAFSGKKKNFVTLQEYLKYQCVWSAVKWRMGGIWCYEHYSGWKSWLKKCRLTCSTGHKLWILIHFSMIKAHRCYLLWLIMVLAHNTEELSSHFLEILHVETQNNNAKPCPMTCVCTPSQYHTCFLHVLSVLHWEIQKL